MASIVEVGMLSTSSAGTPVDITTTASAGDSIHAVPASQSDRVLLFANNYGSATREQIVIEAGGTAAKNRMRQWVEPDMGLVPVLANILLVRSVGTPAVTAWASTANVISLIGMVERVGGTAAYADRAAIKLSGGTDGLPIDISATTSGTAITLHTATSVASERDFVYLWGFSTDTDSARGLAIELGGASASSTMTVTILPGQGPVLLIPGLPFASGVVIKGYAVAANDGTAAAASKVSVYGEVHRRSAP